MKRPRFIPLPIVFLCWYFALSPLGTKAGPQFIRHLPNLTINAFVQDSIGYVWIATGNGLCRYNGQLYYYYQNEPDNPSSLPDNRIHALHTAPDGVLWIVSDSGISTYDSMHDCFRHVLCRKGLHGIAASGSRVLCYGPGGMVLLDTTEASVIHQAWDARHCPDVLEADGNGDFWGAFSGNPASMLRYGPDLAVRDSLVLPHKTAFYSSCHDRKGRIWLGMEQGIFVLDPVSGESADDPALARCLKHVADYCVSMLFSDRAGTVYIGTRGDNIHTFNTSNGNAEYNIVNRFQLSYTSDFRCGFSDMEGNVWIGTGDRGYSVRYAHRKNFTVSGRLAKLTQGKYINAITLQQDGTLWVGSRYKGLLAYNSRNPVAQWYSVANCAFMRQIASNGIEALYAASDQRLWINLADRIVVCDTRLTRITGHELLPERLAVNRFCEDSDGRVWAAARNGLVVWERSDSPRRLFSDRDVQDVVRLDDTTLLAAVSGAGIFAVDTRRLRTRRCFESSDSLVIRGLRNLSCLLPGDDRSLWIGTRSNGLLHCDSTGLFSSYTLGKGLASNEISDLARDASGNLWVSTSYGLSLLTAGADHVINYFQSDRLQTQQFCPHCVLATPSTLYFGGNLGLAQFSPQRILSQISKQPVQLVFTEIRINSVVQVPLENGLLTRALNDTERIVLNHKQRNIDIGYEAVAFLSPEKIRFAYRLSGRNVDSEWKYVENLRNANYAHLPAGRYLFELKAQNPDGFWNAEPRRLEIIIRPSPLLTWYAFLFYVLAVGGGAWFANRFYLRRKLQKMELTLARTELEREKELTNMKINFFTNISHELRTPLTLIYGPVNILPEVTDRNRMRELISLINYNIQKLLDLVDQTLNLSRIENDTLPLSVCRQDILPYVHRLLGSFTCYADEKQISMRLESTPSEHLVVALDLDKFGKILSNLLSNALKYTPEDGHVEVVLRLGSELPESLADAFPASQYLIVSVCDDGIGMSQQDIERIFERYKRLTQSERSTVGSGIGLHYVKQLLRVHKGSIAAEVRPSGGMSFTFAIPVDKALYELSDEPTITTEFIDGMTSAAVEPCASLESEEIVPQVEKAEESRPKIVIVEDNPQLRHYCKMIFTPHYQVFTAENGLDGLDLVNAEMPDVVITDLLMSKMDGYELCRRIKGDLVLSHIPVIMLTAKSSDQDKIIGYQEGANVYITKPFNPRLLQTVVGNLLASQKRIREMILSQSGKPLAEREIPDASGIPGDEIGNGVRLSPADQAFLDKLCRMIDENLSDCTLNIHTICIEMCMSRASFFRKIKSLTGVTPNQFILIYRLNRAAEMVRSREFRFNEIADLVGFSSQSHFSRCFKQHFGVSPKEYVNRS